MAYAKLVFSPGTYSLKKLKEIVRFATGQIATTADLEFADSSLSEVVIIDQPGWSLQAQSFEASGTATTASYRLTAPCVDSSKNKCILINTRIYRAISSPSGSTTSIAVQPSSTATAAYLETTMGSSWTGSTLNNQTRFVSAYANANSPGAGGRTITIYGTSLSPDIVYIFSSARKLIIFSPESTGRSDYTAILEFPETIHTIKHLNTPCLLSEATYANAATIVEVLGNGTGGYTYSSTTGPTYYYKHQLTNWYSPITLTRDNRRLYDWGINNIEVITAPSALNINSSGTSAYPLIPITDVRLDYGEGIHNYSALTDMYITFRASAYTGQGDTLDVNGNDYVVLQVGTSTSNYRAFAIKKG